MRYDTYGIFYISVNFVFNFPHYVTSYMHHTGKKERVKRDYEESKQKRLRKICFKDSNPDPENQLELKVNASIHWIKLL